jgi:hypothetical protein
MDDQEIQQRAEELMREWLKLIDDYIEEPECPIRLPDYVKTPIPDVYLKAFGEKESL